MAPVGASSHKPAEYERLSTPTLIIYGWENFSIWLLRTSFRLTLFFILLPSFFDTVHAHTVQQTLHCMPSFHVWISLLYACIYTYNKCISAFARVFTFREKDTRLGRAGSEFLRNIPQSSVHVIKGGRHPCYLGEYMPNYLCVCTYVCVRMRVCVSVCLCVRMWVYVCAYVSILSFVSSLALFSQLTDDPTDFLATVVAFLRDLWVDVNASRCCRSVKGKDITGNDELVNLRAR